MILDTRCANIALATNLDNSEDHKLPASVCSPPIKTREGLNKSLIAVPSAKNSGLESTWKEWLDALFKTRLMESAVRTGTVDFSTTILPELASSAIVRAQISTFLMLEAWPAPIPEVLVGVFTLTKITSLSLMVPALSVEKNKFLFYTSQINLEANCGNSSKLIGAWEKKMLVTDRLNDT